ncbi:MAG: MucR family transcriptional regulator [Kaiparowitsia implicata GSE-PSE-MK54-09C]|nr:MucR family transcriptional regulator [Kaiparowitsia implicata GSE-PSE-MK54-09C]
MNDTTEPSMTDAIRLEQVAEIVSAYVANNAVSTADLPALIASTHRAMASLSAASVDEQAEELKPAVPIRKSVTPDFIICLDDGKKFKSLKRHLSVLGMTPTQYRAKWKLPSDYPMVASNYAAIRSALAKSNGLGRAPAAEPVLPTKRGRKPRAEA